MEIYSIVYTYVTTSGVYNNATARIIGAFSEKDEAIEQAGRWLGRANKVGMSMRRISGTEWILWNEAEKKGGYLTVETNILNKNPE